METLLSTHVCYSGRGFSKQVLGLSCTQLAWDMVCRQHQAGITLVNVIDVSGFRASLFCATLLVRRFRIRCKMRKQLRHHMQSGNFEVIYDEEDPNDKAQVHAVLDLLLVEYSKGLAKQGERQESSKRVNAVRRLKVFLAGPIRGSKWRHCCKAGCHECEEDAMEELLELLDIVMINSPPPPPVWNKWLKISPSPTWFSVFTSLHELLPTLLAGILKELLGNEEVEFDEDDLLELDDRKSFIRQEQAYLRKTSNFLLEPHTTRKLAGIISPVRLGMRVLQKGFESAKRYMDHDKSILLFVDPETNPAVATIREAMQHLRNQDSPFWCQLRSLFDDWTELEYFRASTPVWVMIGNLSHRLVHEVDRWPFRMGLFFSAHLDEAAKNNLADELWNLCEHTDGYTRRVKEGAANSAQIRGRMQTVEHDLRHTPVTNMISESSFAQSAGRRAPNHGNEMDFATYSSNHVPPLDVDVVSCIP